MQNMRVCLKHCQQQQIFTGEGKGRRYGGKQGPNTEQPRCSGGGMTDLIYVHRDLCQPQKRTGDKKVLTSIKMIQTGI